MQNGRRKWRSKEMKEKNNEAVKKWNEETKRWCTVSMEKDPETAARLLISGTLIANWGPCFRTYHGPFIAVQMKKRRLHNKLSHRGHFSHANKHSVHRVTWKKEMKKRRRIFEYQLNLSTSEFELTTGDWVTYTKQPRLIWTVDNMNTWIVGWEE